ncbi:MAG: DUF721 domain-containing protein [Deltaproteobacteria bacterium]|nr:DUF721 domain-containing protein [Deltaproteobacteria bacterium]MBW2414597.1 DUF721 domain-containing protein [Deltaproteobacteria bacterium]
MARPPKRRNSRPEAVSDLLPKVLVEMGLDETSDSVQLLQAWGGALGPELAPHTRCEGLRRGVVNALVRDSAWMQRVQMEKPRILAALAKQLGPIELRDLRLRLGSVDD